MFETQIDGIMRWLRDNQSDLATIVFLVPGRQQWLQVAIDDETDAADLRSEIERMWCMGFLPVGIVRAFDKDGLRIMSYCFGAHPMHEVTTAVEAAKYELEQAYYEMRDGGYFRRLRDEPRRFILN